MLSAVVVNYRTPAETAAAVASLAAQSSPPDAIVVVDNGAADGLPLPDLPSLRGIRVEQPDENIGFGAACNLGARLTHGDSILLMNADVVLSTRAVENMLESLAADPRIAVVGPRVFSSGYLQHSARAFPSVRTGLLGRRSTITRLLSRSGRSPAELRPAYGSGGEVDWVSGACMLVRRTAFEAADGFDESFWMYWEDADLCRRLVDAGWRVYYQPAAVVHHATGASGANERTVRAFHDSAARFADRHIAQSGLSRIAVRSLLQIRAWLMLHATRWSNRSRVASSAATRATSP